MQTIFLSQKYHDGSSDVIERRKFTATMKTRWDQQRRHHKPPHRTTTTSEQRNYSNDWNNSECLTGAKNQERIVNFRRLLNSYYSKWRSVSRAAFDLLSESHSRTNCNVRSTTERVEIIMAFCVFVYVVVVDCCCCCCCCWTLSQVLTTSGKIFCICSLLCVVFVRWV